MANISLETNSSGNFLIKAFSDNANVTKPRLALETGNDDRPILLNSRDYTQTSGTSLGVQSRVRQTAATTGDVVGVEFSPRTAGVGTGALIAVRGDPVLQTASATATVSAVRGFECNIDFSDSGSAYTITNNVNAFRTFLDMGSGHTVSGKKAVICVATPNTSGWDYLLDLETSSGVVTDAAVGGSQNKKINIRIAGTNYFIPCNTA